MTSLHDKFGWRSSSFYDSSPLLQRLSFHSGWAACSVVVVTPGSGFCGLLNLVWRRNDGFRSCIFTRPVARIPRLYHLTSRWLPGPKACGFDSTYSYSAITFFSMSVCLPHCNLFFSPVARALDDGLTSIVSTAFLPDDEDPDDGGDREERRLSKHRILV